MLDDTGKDGFMIYVTAKTGKDGQYLRVAAGKYFCRDCNYCVRITSSVGDYARLRPCPKCGGLTFSTYNRSVDPAVPNP